MKQQTVGNIHIGLREHSPLSPRYIRGMVRRRLRQGLNLDYLWPSGWSPEPDMVCALPTYRCNLRCKMCFQRDENGVVRLDMRHEELEPEQWLRIIDQVAQFSTTIFWMGGEVMIYPRFMDLLAHCKARGLRVVMITNGIHAADVAEELVALGIDAITISIDGFEETHNKIRRNPHSYACAVESLQAIRQARERQHQQLPLLTINHAITKDNYRQIPAFFEFARELGADMLQFIGLMYMDEETAVAHKIAMRQLFGVEVNVAALDNGADREGIDALWLQETMDNLREGAPAAPTLRFCSLGLENNLMAHYGPDEGLPLPKQRCTAVYRRLVIQPNGDVALCYNQPELVMGNVLTADLSDIWNGAKFREARQQLRQELLPGCIRCGWLDYE
jgi:radical SAM protein with 4Fe4S-binding SPASM domain